MFSRLREILAPQEAQPAEPDPELLKIATCAVLLEAAGADDEFAPEECERIIAMLRERFALDQNEAEELVQAAEQRRAETFDLWQFTNEINQSCSPDEKVRVIEEVWRVIFADGTLDGHEDYLVHKLARLLNLNHPQLIKAKMAVLEELKGQ